MNKKTLDVCCGARMFYFDKNDDRVLFCDKRKEIHILCDGRTLNITPDYQCDFRKLPFQEKSFFQVVFDPPHMIKVGAKSWLALKYGKLEGKWQDDIKKGFSECFRVLKTNGTLIFKWNERDILTSEILKLTDYKPVFGHRSGKAMQTHWVVFIK